MLKSATRIALLILIVVLCVITTYVTVKYIPERFTAVFSLFSGVTMTLIGFFTGKSMQESAKTTPPATIGTPPESLSTVSPTFDLEK